MLNLNLKNNFLQLYIINIVFNCASKAFNNKKSPDIENKCFERQLLRIMQKAKQKIYSSIHNEFKYVTLLISKK